MTERKLALTEGDGEGRMFLMVRHSHVSIYYSLLINSLYEILRDSLVDAVIHNGDKQNGQEAFLEMVNMSNYGRIIVIISYLPILC